jgi:nitrogen fixation NifU-like protein
MRWSWPSSKRRSFSNMQPNPPIELDDLYQEIILDHFKHPRHSARLSDEEVLVDEENPTCGDQIRLTARVEDGVLRDIRYEAHGCAISVASSSMMSETLIGKPVEEARRWIRDFTGIMTARQPAAGDLGELVALEGVKRYPLRIKCATMSWHALNHALDKLVGPAR